MEIMRPEQARAIFTRLRSDYASFLQELELVRATGKQHAGHGPDHDELVAGYTIVIAGGDNLTARKVWITAMLHSLDRAFGSERAFRIINNLFAYLPREFSESDLKEILNVALYHSGPNDSDDSQVKIILQDADRLANMGPMLIIRSGQHYPNIPALETTFLGYARNPEGTFRKPKSCFDDVKASLDWESEAPFGLRTPVARELAKKYFDFLRQFLVLTRTQYIEAGVTA